MKTRVVVTGLGVVCPIGNNVEEFWSSLLDGKSGVGTITRFDTTAYPTRIAAEVKNLDLSGILDKKEIRRMDPSGQYAMAASEEAVKDSGLDLEAVDLDRCGVIIGSGIG